ncbi:MAG: barstar family protein [Acidothermaceae bacterium]
MSTRDDALTPDPCLRSWRALDFPGFFGRNLDALNDCMHDVVTGDYGSRLDATGFALVLRHYDKFVRLEAEAAHSILDIIAGQCRNGALIGHRRMCLVQSDDPKLHFAPVGGTPVLWNEAEWLNTRRGKQQPPT